MTALQEYDLEFKLATIIKEQQLCNLMVEIQNNEDDDWENEAELQMVDMCVLSLQLWSLGTKIRYITFDRDIYLNNGILNKEENFV